MSLSHALLALAKEQPRYPYAMKSAFEEVFGDFWPLNYGQVHQSLESLYKKGMLSVDLDPIKPERKLYSITPQGEKELDTWSREGSVKIRPLRDEIYLRLYLLGHEPTHQLVDLFEEYRLAYAKQLRMLMRRRAILLQNEQPEERAVPIQRLLIDAAIEHTEAEVRWLDSVREAFEKVTE